MAMLNCRRIAAKTGLYDMNAAIPQLPPKSANSADRATLLLVDDTPDNLTILSEILEPHYRVRAASSGERALQIVQHSPTPDLVLLDVMMPDMDGHQVFARLRESNKTRHVPVIFVSAMNADEDEIKGLEEGAVDYITKPFHPSIVLARVRTHLELKNVRDQISQHNAALEIEVQSRIEEIQRVQDVTIHALARLAETRDPETGNHILRTQEYVRTLAQTLQSHPRFKHFLTDHNIRLLAKSAPLHDIGKVGIPDHILLKPGKLTPEEFEIMKTHAGIGSDALARAEQDIEGRVSYLGIAKDIARHHHERWDGKGYPDSLAGDAIPISARLMALADVFDALISQRVYKPAFPFSKAKEIITAEAGKHFDPDVAKAFLDSFDVFCSIANRYRDDPEHQSSQTA